MNFSTPYDCAMPKRLTLEQRIRKLARRYRARQRREAEKVNRPEPSPRRRTASWASTIGLVVLVQFAASGATASTFEKANVNYAAGRFADAAHGFEQTIAERGYSAPVLFNLGNAWLKDSQPGRAILNYERALSLAPNDPAIAANLRVARQQAGLKEHEKNTLEEAARVLSLDTLAWTLVWSSALLFAVVLVSRLLSSFPRRVGRILVGMGAVALVTAGVGVSVQWPERDQAVVLDPATPVHIAPAPAAGVTFNLSAGEMVRVRKSHGAYTLIRTRDGRVGWVKSAAVERVI
jgi:tetratricopeptide (TPR) repeat protein